MAIGPGIYFNKYKDYSVDELERELEKLQKYLSSDELKKARQEEIDKGIDDNNCVDNIITKIKVIESLIKEKNLKLLEEKEIDLPKSSVNGDLNIQDEELKKIVQEVIGNNDPYWNNSVYDIVKKIIDLPFEMDITIAKLINYNPEEVIIDPLTQGQIRNLVEAVCKKINIKLEVTRDKVGGLAYYYSFKKIATKNEVFDKLKCPVCSRILMCLMPDGSHLYCKNCEKYYLNNNGNVGDETTLPYNRNDVLY